MEKNIKDSIIEQQQKQLEKNQSLLNDAICTIANIVKDSQRTLKLTIIVNAITLSVILSVFFIGYFFSSYDSNKTTTNYNENVNRNINGNGGEK